MASNSNDHSESRSSAYRAYLIGSDGKVDTSVTIPANNDHDAIELVRLLPRAYEVELWDRSRVVIRLPTITAR